jgi:hypothetical protein
MMEKIRSLMPGILAVVAACLLISANSAAGADLALPDGGDRITAPWKPENSRSGTPVKWNKVNDKPFDQIAEITVKEVPVQPYHRQLILPVTESIQQSDVLHLRLWARTVGETKLGKISVVVEEDREPWEKILQDRAFRLHPQWRQLDIPFVAGRACAPGASAVKIRLGFKKQQLQIAGVALHNFGKGQATPDSLPHTEVTYPGRSENAPWRIL